MQPPYVLNQPPYVLNQWDETDVDGFSHAYIREWTQVLRRASEEQESKLQSFCTLSFFLSFVFCTHYKLGIVGLGLSEIRVVISYILPS